MLNKTDLDQIAKHEITEEQIAAQVSRFKKGFQPLHLLAAATVGNGIIKLTDEEIQTHISNYEEAEAKVIKFVPASGAASRMFKALFALLDMDTTSYLNSEITQVFFERLSDFAFYEDLKSAFIKNNDLSFDEAVLKKDKRIIATLLNEDGLDYGSLPKGLLLFHKYKDEPKTPVQEHITEGLSYANKIDKINIHFTVSPDHQLKFEAHVDRVLNDFIEPEKIKIDYSTQKNATDTIAVDLNNQLFRTENGELLFRPAGHGALLANLNELDADIVFIKNIDNVVPDRIKAETTRYKKALAGVLLFFQKQAFELITQGRSGADIAVKGLELLQKMGIKGNFSNEEVLQLLDRPIRVCGMVKNEGEPGGGPFWVKSQSGEALQIVESAQVNSEDSNQHAVFSGSTHFNPVDLVCGLKDVDGNSFDLLKYRDDDTGFITEKSFQGEKLKAMELPGLWNGSMAHWNTLFVEVPLITFNPVKTVMDLLKEPHQ